MLKLQIEEANFLESEWEFRAIPIHFHFIQLIYPAQGENTATSKNEGPWLEEPKGLATIVRLKASV